MEIYNIYDSLRCFSVNQWIIISKGLFYILIYYQNANCYDIRHGFSQYTYFTRGFMFSVKMHLNAICMPWYKCISAPQFQNKNSLEHNFVPAFKFWNYIPSRRQFSWTAWTALSLLPETQTMLRIRNIIMCDLCIYKYLQDEAD